MQSFPGQAVSVVVVPRVLVCALTVLMTLSTMPARGQWRTADASSTAAPSTNSPPPRGGFASPAANAGPALSAPAAATSNYVGPQPGYAPPTGTPAPAYTPPYSPPPYTPPADTGPAPVYCPPPGPTTVGPSTLEPTPPPCDLLLPPATEPPMAMRAAPEGGGYYVKGDPNTWWDLKVKGRAYYLNDQRIEWSGLESTFGAEGVIAPVFKHRYNDWEFTLDGEFYLNEPFDGNILVNTAERQSYLANFQVPQFQISKLEIKAQYGDWLITLGKMDTPFGRYYFPLYTNSMIDAPFIRSEAINWRETGVDLRWHPGIFVGDVAITNGGDDRDTNSSKALIARLGLEGQNWAFGASIKAQDGIGSDAQKAYDSYSGFDAMIRFGPYTLSAEAIYDQYGAKYPIDPNSITWGRSLYYRDLNYQSGTPFTGFGYYVNLDWQLDPWQFMLNYGEFYPNQAGTPAQNIINRRGILKVVYNFTPHLKNYNMLYKETDAYTAQEGRARIGWVGLTGLEFSF